MTHEAAFAALVDAAAQRYRPAGKGAYHFARGKLGGDPVFAAILTQGLIADDARLVDLGCGQGVLLALLAAADDEDARASWPADLPPLPRGIVGSGVDLRADAIRAARLALGHSGEVQVGDICEVPIPRCDVVTILDVLHYIDYAAQRRLLQRVHAALVPGGRLVLRAGDASQGLRFRLTLAGDWLITLARGRLQTRFFCRTAAQWLGFLHEVGFEARVQPMSAGTPFANVLLDARRL